MFFGWDVAADNSHAHKQGRACTLTGQPNPVLQQRPGVNNSPRRKGGSGEGLWGVGGLQTLLKFLNLLDTHRKIMTPKLAPLSSPLSPDHMGPVWRPNQLRTQLILRSLSHQAWANPQYQVTSYEQKRP